MTRKMSLVSAICVFSLLATSSMSQVFDWAIEAETADAIQAPMVIAEDPNASGGQFIWWEGPPATQTPIPCGKGAAEYKINIPVAGTYEIWARVTAWDPESDSFWVTWQPADSDENPQ